MINLTPEIEHFIHQHLNTHSSEIVLKIRQNLKIPPDFILSQINGRNKAPHKLPTWLLTQGMLFPSPVSFEQCSSELTARFKASLIKGKCIIDITGGFGVDTYFLSQQFETVFYCEQNEDLFEIACHNFKSLGATHIQTYLGNGLDFLSTLTHKTDWIYLDPARRNDAKGKVFLLEDCTPDITQIQEQLANIAPNILLKLSPMLDLTEILKKVKNVQQIWIIAVKNECKEVLLHLSHSPNTEIQLHCVNLQEAQTPEVFSGKYSDRQTASVKIENPLAYIYEPNKAILKAGLQDSYGATLALSKVDYRSNFFTSNELNSSFLGRIFKQKAIIKLKKQQIQPYLKDGKANIIARNFPLNAAQIYEQYKIIPGGDIYLLATQINKKEKTLIVCERLK